MRLPALDPRERAYLQALSPNSAVRSFASRLRQRLLASLGVPAEVSEAQGGGAQVGTAGEEPMIAIEPGLAAAWLALRLGGRPGTHERALKDASLSDPLRALVGRALAEAVINSGEAVWPQSMRLHVALGGRQGIIEIFWNGAQAMGWARRVVREKA